MTRAVLDLDDDDLDLLRYILDWQIDQWTDEEEVVLLRDATDPSYTSIESMLEGGANLVEMTKQARRIRAQLNPMEELIT